jgi:hypothetical protein
MAFHGLPITRTADPELQEESRFFPSITTAVNKPAAFEADQQEIDESYSNKTLSPAKDEFSLERRGERRLLLRPERRNP